MVRKDIFHEFRKGEDAENDSYRQPEQESSVNCLPEIGETALEKHLPGRETHQGVQRFYQFIEYAGEQGDSTSGHPRNDICRTHGESLECDNYVFDQICHELLDLAEIDFNGIETLHL